MVSTFEHCRFCSGRGCTACPEEHRKWEANGGKFPPNRIVPPPPPPVVGTCYVCGEPARFLCDGPLPNENDPEQGKRSKTCDRPMCDAHIAYQTRVHVQRAGPNGRGRRCSWETIDLCAACLDRREEEIEQLRQRLDEQQAAGPRRPA